MYKGGRMKLGMKQDTYSDSRVSWLTLKQKAWRMSQHSERVERHSFSLPFSQIRPSPLIICTSMPDVCSNNPIPSKAIKRSFVLPADSLSRVFAFFCYQRDCPTWKCNGLCQAPFEFYHWVELDIVSSGQNNIHSSIP